MVIHDCSTTVSCDIGSNEITINKKLSVTYMRKIINADGWRRINNKDVCPECVARMEKRGVDD